MNSHTQASQAVKLFESTRVRSHGDAAQEKWYFSVVDVVQVLTHNIHQEWTGLSVQAHK